MERRRTRRFTAAQRITVTGMMASLSLVCLYLAGITPTLRLTLYGLSSLFVAVLLIEGETIMAWLMYIGVCFLGTALVQDKLKVLPYILFFGNYGIIKYYIEKLGNLVGEYGLKLVYLNVVIAAIYYFAGQVLLADIRLKLPIAVIMAAAQVAFLVYDYVYTRLIEFYHLRIRKHMLRE